MRILLFTGVAGHASAVEAIAQSVGRIDECEPICLGGAANAGSIAQDALSIMRRRGIALIASAAERACLEGATGIDRADLAYLRRASAARRMRAGARSLLLSAHAEEADPRAFVIRPGAHTSIGQAGATVAPVSASSGEAPCLLVDTRDGAIQVRHVVWDAPRTTRHV